MKTSKASLFSEEARWRHEIKYAVSSERASEISAALSPLLREDENSDEEGGYLVKSLYFDTPLFDDYRDKELGAAVRQKLRLRSYGEGSFYRLEMKKKEGFLNAKLSVSLSREEALSLINGETGLLLYKGEEGEYLYAFMKSRAYRPSLVIKYERRALLAADGGLRLTFDTRLTCSRDPLSLFEARSASDQPLKDCVIELKYGDFLPLWVSRRLEKCGLASGEFGKYTLACESVLGYVL